MSFKEVPFTSTSGCIVVSLLASSWSVFRGPSFDSPPGSFYHTTVSSMVAVIAKEGVSTAVAYIRGTGWYVAAIAMCIIVGNKMNK